MFLKSFRRGLLRTPARVPEFSPWHVRVLSTSTADACFSHDANTRSHLVVGCDWPWSSFQELAVAMDIGQRRSARIAAPSVGLVPPHPHLGSRDFLLLSVSLSFPFGLALVRAETLRPAPGAALLRANSARPPGFGSPSNISNLSQPRLDEILPVPPKKHVPGLGAAASRSPGAQAKRAEKE